MELDIIDYNDMSLHKDILIEALKNKGIVGVRNIPGFKENSKNYIEIARKFCALKEDIKNHYAPDRDKGQTEGFEIGAEQFQ
ncbi:MAG: hypothetical protein KC505_05940, partial [Myxococcales bacterium]|nr:hypothetical protein [Myxococcales bacterium]